MSSATGGFLTATTMPLPGDLSFEQYMHGLISGVSGLAPDLVRPKFQPNPPKPPGFNIEWAAFALTESAADANPSTRLNELDSYHLKRSYTITISTSWYGPRAFDVMSGFCDGLWIPQNWDEARKVGIDFRGIATQPMKGPDLVHERWVERWDFSFLVAREVTRSYDVLPISGIMGIIKADKEGLESTFEQE